MKKMKLAKFFLPAIAIMAMALGNTPAQAAQKIKIGVAMALFDDVWLTNVRDAMTKWGTTHPDVELQEWIHSVASDKIKGPSSWDGYAAAVTADACVEAQKNGKIVAIKLGTRPGLYHDDLPAI